MRSLEYSPVDGREVGLDGMNDKIGMAPYDMPTVTVLILILII